MAFGGPYGCARGHLALKKFIFRNRHLGAGAPWALRPAVRLLLRRLTEATPLDGAEEFPGKNALAFRVRARPTGKSERRVRTREENEK